MFLIIKQLQRDILGSFDGFLTFDPLILSHCNASILCQQSADFLLIHGLMSPCEPALWICLVLQEQYKPTVIPPCTLIKSACIFHLWHLKHTSYWFDITEPETMPPAPLVDNIQSWDIETAGWDTEPLKCYQTMILFFSTELQGTQHNQQVTFCWWVYLSWLTLFCQSVKTTWTFFTS